MRSDDVTLDADYIEQEAGEEEGRASVALPVQRVRCVLCDEGGDLPPFEGCPVIPQELTPPFFGRLLAALAGGLHACVKMGTLMPYDVGSPQRYEVPVLRVL